MMPSTTLDSPAMAEVVSARPCVAWYRAESAVMSRQAGAAKPRNPASAPGRPRCTRPV